MFAFGWTSGNSHVCCKKPQQMRNLPTAHANGVMRNTLTEAYLFDWGDTLMVDFPDKEGRMMDWDVVEEIEGANEALSYLSKHSKIYVGTGAPKTTSESIKGALKRVGLDKYISGCFCPSVIGYAKPNLEFYSTICSEIGLNEADVTMVGDSLERDVVPALKTGLQAVWLNMKCQSNHGVAVREIKSLVELCS